MFTFDACRVDEEDQEDPEKDPYDVLCFFEYKIQEFGNNLNHKTILYHSKQQSMFDVLY